MDSINDLLIGTKAGLGKTYLLGIMSMVFLNIKYDNCCIYHNPINQIVSSKSVFNVLKQELVDYDEIHIVTNPNPKIINTLNGATIYFKSTQDVERAKTEFNGTSYDFIGSEESCFMPVEVLEYYYRSLRGSADTNISKILLHVSNRLVS